MYTLTTPKFIISRLDHSSELQTHTMNLLLSMSIWRANRCPKLNYILLLLSTTPSLVFHVLLHLKFHFCDPKTLEMFLTPSTCPRWHPHPTQSISTPYFHCYILVQVTKCHLDYCKNLLMFSYFYCCQWTTQTNTWSSQSWCPSEGMLTINKMNMGSKAEEGVEECRV